MAYLDPGDPVQLAAQVRAAFEERYDAPAAAVGRAPGRVNLMGEHTDYNAGLVLPVALPHTTHAAWRPTTDGRLRVASRQRESTWEGRVDDLGPDAVDGWAAYAAGVVWALREAGVEIPGCDLLVDSTVPVGAGLSSSAALECAVAVALAPDADRRLLAAACIRAETEIAGAPTGGMDQYVALLAEPGQALLIDFESDETTQVPLDLTGHTLLVTDTRVSHELTDGGYGSRRADCEEAARQLRVPTLRRASLATVEDLEDERVRRRARHVVTEISRVTAAVNALATSDWGAVGELFRRSHASMRDDFEISTPELDAAVVVAVEAGAVAARMTGGGFGGSTVAIVPDDRVEAVMRAVDATFVLEGFKPPAHLRAEPSAGASAG
ncbi:galactokinase [Nocardioides sp. W7]|uniref:galactokinase n=1 Tax=Nocardioides sp. W7 TaxID=2931390 RepID=UPI001FD11C36|nr:galactokinase [Nocardioides sp. W7]